MQNEGAEYTVLIVINHLSSSCTALAGLDKTLELTDLSFYILGMKNGHCNNTISDFIVTAESKPLGS